MKEQSGAVAMERLKDILGREKHFIDEDMMNSIRRDIGNVVSKYVDVEPENVEIKIILREYKKREQNV